MRFETDEWPFPTEPNPQTVHPAFTPTRPEETTMPTDTAAAGSERLDIEALMHEHWLLSDQVVGRGLVVTGCHCGFRADLDSDCGYGDSVVRHLFEIATAAPADVEVREEWGVRWAADNHGEMQQSDAWFDTEEKRQRFVAYLGNMGGSALAFATRITTHATTRWEPQP